MRYLPIISLLIVSIGLISTFKPILVLSGILFLVVSALYIILPPENISSAELNTEE